MLSEAFHPMIMMSWLNPLLVSRIARLLLESHFPETVHQDILDAVGLSLITGDSQSRRRDSNFRENVLRAYGFRCCICGYDVRLGAQFIGLEAAHIKWFQAGGPDAVPNGLSLCT